MNIRFKTLTINSLALARVVVIVYAVATPYILHGFKKVERATDAVNHGSRSLDV